MAERLEIRSELVIQGTRAFVQHRLHWQNVARSQTRFQSGFWVRACPAGRQSERRFTNRRRAKEILTGRPRGLRLATTVNIRPAGDPDSYWMVKRAAAKVEN